VLFINAGVHGGEYPAIEAVIRLGNTLDPGKIAGTVILMPVLNLPAFRSRTPFVCPVDNVNPNRVFPGDPKGSYSEQMTHALINAFVAYADAYLDLHGGDIPEALVPFSICRAGSETGRAVATEAVSSVDARSKAMAIAFGLPYVLAVTKPVQPSKGLSSYAAAAERGVPSVLAEAGGVGQLQEDAVAMLMDGVRSVMGHLGMMEAEDAAGTAAATEEAKDRRSQTAATGGAETGRRPVATPPTVLTRFEWIYTKNAGMWYPGAAAGDLVEKGKEIGAIGSLFGDVTEKIIAPVTGRVLFLTINPSVSENGLLMGIGVA
jgi:predicted deacylase